MEDTFHPTLFNRKKTAKKTQFSQPTQQIHHIPLQTIYTQPMHSQHTTMEEHTRIFGFSQNNLDNVLEKINEAGRVVTIEHGKNWVDVEFEDDESINKCYLLNNTTINGEMIGVIRKRLVKGENVFKTKKGIFRRLVEYLFGE
ncbi:hypothetical protein TCON_2279 [Astathelohania contejeani]|uniref:RRM Nup35-type domain-containing protein n=1 Tax=Astathelohania contejeani TaxID=164912 RepID=A0ABQ7HWF1_9MICR|nr:hypothetical protein TCON_2279 [Thelohania contejeani]